MYLAAQLIKAGHDAAVYGLYQKVCDKFVVVGGHECPVILFQRDGDNTPAHGSMSDLLLERLLADGPDIVLIKGVDYALARQIARSALAPKVGFIIGGRSEHALLKDCRIVFFETEQQLATYTGRAVACVLPKFIPWQFVKKRDFADIRFDVVNVGNFNEARKAQELLFPLSLSHKVLLIGGGAREAPFKELAKGYPNISFGGFVDTPTLFSLLAQCRLMVHCSLWDGYPRAVAEALAAGVPVVGLKGVLSGMAEADIVRCVAIHELYPQVEALLSDADALNQLGLRAQTYMMHEARHERVLEIFLDALSKLTKTR
jgi:glycosyltransferase involved in cell wall biosynthesis